MRLWFYLLILVIVVTACVPINVDTPVPQETPVQETLQPPVVNTTPVPDPHTAARAFLDDWENENYEALYNHLTLLSRDAISYEDYSKRLKEIAATMSLKTVDFEILQSLIKDPNEAQVAYRAMYQTVLVGDIVRETFMNLSLQNGTWKVQWEDGMILPELRGGNRLVMDISIPARGNIYDSEGRALAAQSDAVALGIVPGRIEEGKEESLLVELSNLTGLHTDYIRSLYEFAAPEWYIPVADVSGQAVQRRFEVLATLGGLVMNRYNTRYYFDSTAPHITGYVQPIPAERLEEFRRLGYRGDERVGMGGLESWGEQYLAGQRGASLYVVDSQGVRITRLVQRDSAPAHSIYSTIDKDLQLQTQRAIEGFRGAVVVLELDTGRVLAMASSPSYNPNLFDPSNFNNSWLLGELFDSTNVPLLNRAAQSAYPLGSVFKIITMAAALETGAFTEDTVYNCGHAFTDLIGYTLYDWTYEKERPPSGPLTLGEGLMRSCNPWFFHIGLSMFQQGFTEDISRIGRAFGLGSPTGIEQILEVSGNMPNPNNENDAVQLAIGQGTMLTTPLQTARFIAAIGNGGTLYRPQVVERVTDPDGAAIISFQPEEQGKLPVSPENLVAVQEALRSVVTNPRGTAQFVMVGLQVPVYGKTGTAQNSAGRPHAWFGGYTNARREDLPDISVVVLVENVGEGSEFAAPIFRRVVESYFFGRPVRLYPWESTFFVTRTPTSLFTETPHPENTPEP